MNLWAANIALMAIGLNHDQRQEVLKAIPVIDKMVKHLNENSELLRHVSDFLVKIGPVIDEGAKLFDQVRPLVLTELADWKIIAPSVKLVADAMAAKGFNFGHLAAAYGQAMYRLGNNAEPTEEQLK
jgi:hypothetical protein